MQLPSDGATLVRAASLFLAAKDIVGASAAQSRLLLEVAGSKEARDYADLRGIAPLHADLAGRNGDRLLALLAAHDNERAVQESRHVLAASLADPCLSRYVLGKALRKMRQYKKAAGALKSAAKVCGAGDLNYGPRVALLRARVGKIRRQSNTVRHVAQRFVAQHPRHSFADDILHELAAVHGRRARLDAAELVYERIVSEYPDGDMAPRAAWRVALRAIQSGDYPKAAGFLRSNIEQGRWRGRSLARAHYWLGRTLELSDRKAALSAYRAAAAAPALSYYTWLTLSRLRAYDPDAAKILESTLGRERAGRSSRPAPGVLAAEPAYIRAALLTAVGWPEAAVAELGLLEGPGLTVNEALDLASAYSAAGALVESQLVLRRYATATLAEAPVGVGAAAWSLAYSKPYWPEIERAAKEMSVEPLLLVALAREESRFDADVVSWAGAVGLVQLMPPTAIGAYASVEGGRLRDLERLLDPQLNLRLGAFVLREALRQFAGVEPLAIGAYNGGAGLVRRYLPKKKPMDFDLWVESIGVRETRRYIKRVVGTWGVYRYLEGPDVEYVALPAEVVAR